MLQRQISNALLIVILLPTCALLFLPGVAKAAPTQIVTTLSIDYGKENEVSNYAALSTQITAKPGTATGGRTPITFTVTNDAEKELTDSNISTDFNCTLTKQVIRIYDQNGNRQDETYEATVSKSQTSGTIIQVPYPKSYHFSAIALYTCSSGGKDFTLALSGGYVDITLDKDGNGSAVVGQSGNGIGGISTKPLSECEGKLGPNDWGMAKYVADALCNVLLGIATMMNSIMVNISSYFYNVAMSYAEVNKALDFTTTKTP